MSEKKIRTHHAILMREHGKLARQLYERTRQEQGQLNEPRVILIEEETTPIREVDETCFVYVQQRTCSWVDQSSVATPSHSNVQIRAARRNVNVHM
jgi:predicted nucleic acid-binding protein